MVLVAPARIVEGHSVSAKQFQGADGATQRTPFEGFTFSFAIGALDIPVLLAMQRRHANEIAFELWVVIVCGFHGWFLLFLFQC